MDRIPVRFDARFPRRDEPRSNIDTCLVGNSSAWPYLSCPAIVWQQGQLMTIGVNRCFHCTRKWCQTVSTGATWCQSLLSFHCFWVNSDNRWQPLLSFHQRVCQTRTGEDKRGQLPHSFRTVGKMKRIQSPNSVQSVHSKPGDVTCFESISLRSFRVNKLRVWLSRNRYME